MTLEDVRAALEPEEPDYQLLARTLGDKALPHLQRLSVGTDPRMATRATYLAGIIGTRLGVSIVAQAAQSAERELRLAAASAAQHLPPELAERVLMYLIEDPDAGVQKAALRSTPPAISQDLWSIIRDLDHEETEPFIRKLAHEVLARVDATKPRQA